MEDFRYPRVIKHGVLQNGPLISDVPINPPLIGYVPLSCLMTPEGIFQTYFGIHFRHWIAKALDCWVSQGLPTSRLPPWPVPAPRRAGVAVEGQSLYR